MMRKCARWYLAFIKRLFHKFSFIVILCLIPALIPLGTGAMSEDSGVLTIALSSEDKGKEAEQIIGELLEKESMIRFVYYESGAIDAVRKGNADGAWVFKSRFTERLNKYSVDNPIKALVDVYEREETVPLRISREVLFEALYSRISYSLYRNYVKNSIVADITEEELVADYLSGVHSDIIEISHLNSDVPVEKVNYLTAPLRGLLAVLIVLCALAAAMYFLEDNENGKYDWLRREKRIAPAFASCFAATSLSAAAVFAALVISGMAEGIGLELAALGMLAVSSAGFAVVFCMLFRSPARLGALIPGIIIITIVLSPIFFNLKILKPMRLLLPTHYYIYSVSDISYMRYTVLYIIGVYAAAYLINSLKVLIKR